MFCPLFLTGISRCTKFDGVVLNCCAWSKETSNKIVVGKSFELYFVTNSFYHPQTFFYTNRSTNRLKKSIIMIKLEQDWDDLFYKLAYSKQVTNIQSRSQIGLNYSTSHHNSNTFMQINLNAKY